MKKNKNLDIPVTTSISESTSIGLFCVFGENTIIADNCVISPLVRIGDNVTIDDNVTIRDGAIIESGNNSSRTMINDSVLIETGAIIKGGVTLGKNVQVLSGSVVTKSVPPNAKIGGNPASIVGYVDTERVEFSNKGINEKYNSKISSKVRGVNIHIFPEFSDIRGNLSVGEFEKDIPFSVKRYFLVYGVPNSEVRGEHAHKECHQFLICLSGSCSVIADDGLSREEFLLDKPTIGLHLPPMTWGIQYKYTNDAVLLVFASHHYDASDYLRVYSEFLKLIN